jgi:hypothetical protein
MLRDLPVLLLVAIVVTRFFVRGTLVSFGPADEAANDAILPAPDIESRSAERLPGASYDRAIEARGVPIRAAVGADDAPRGCPGAVPTRHVSVTLGYMKWCSIWSYLRFSLLRLTGLRTVTSAIVASDLGFQNLSSSMDRPCVHRNNS